MMMISFKTYNKNYNNIETNFEKLNCKNEKKEKKIEMTNC